MRRPIKGETVQLVMVFAAVAGTFTRAEARKALGLSASQIDTAVISLTRRGYITKTGAGKYQAETKVMHPGHERGDKIWKAMRFNFSFTPSELALICRTDNGYVNRHLRKHYLAGYIKKNGQRKNFKGHLEQVWRLSKKGKEKAMNPNLEVVKPDPLVVESVKLNRELCTGKYKTTVQSRDKVTRILKRIKNGLEDAGTSSKPEAQ